MTGHQFVIGRKRTTIHRPPALDMELFFVVDPHQQNPPVFDRDRPKHLGGHSGDIPAVGNGVDFCQIFLKQLLLIDGNPAQGNAAVGQRQGVGARGDQDVRPEAIKLVFGLGSQGGGQGHQSHHGGDADQQSCNQKGHARLTPPQVVQSDIAQLHLNLTVCHGSENTRRPGPTQPRR